MALPEREEQGRQRNTLELRGFVANTAAPTRHQWIHVRARQHDYRSILPVERRPSRRRHRMGETRQRQLRQSSRRWLQRQRRGDRTLEGLAHKRLHVEYRSAESAVAISHKKHTSHRRLLRFLCLFVATVVQRLASTG